MIGLCAGMIFNSEVKLSSISSSADVFNSFLCLNLLRGSKCIGKPVRPSRQYYFKPNRTYFEMRTAKNSSRDSEDPLSALIFVWSQGYSAENISQVIFKYYQSSANKVTIDARRVDIEYG